MIIEDNDLILRKLQVFINKNRINRNKILTISNFANLKNLTAENNWIIIYSSYFNKKRLKLDRKAHVIFIRYTIDHIRKKVKLKFSSNFICYKNFIVLKVLTYLKLFFFDNEFDVDYNKKKLFKNSDFYFDEYLFDHLSKSLYKLFIKIASNPEGLDLDELCQIFFQNQNKNINLIHVQICNLRKTLNSLPDCNYRLISENKKYKIKTVI